jgi:hypothetical protein
MSPLAFLQKIDPTPEQVLRVLDLWPTTPINVELICEKLGIELNFDSLNKLTHHGKRFQIASIICYYVKSTMNPNSFATELLMPHKIVSKCIGLQASEVAQIFGVTPQAAEIRLMNL